MWIGFTRPARKEVERFDIPESHVLVNLDLVTHIKGNPKAETGSIVCFRGGEELGVTEDSRTILEFMEKMVP